jgi:hypothetical protein
MANRINSKTDGNLDRSNRQDTTRIKFSPESYSPARSQPKHLDDLIVALANAHENRRAQQVIEWEVMGRHHIQLA